MFQDLLYARLAIWNPKRTETPTSEVEHVWISNARCRRNMRPRRLSVQPRTKIQPVTRNVELWRAKLKILHPNASFQRLEFFKFRSKRVNRPTSEAQPQKQHSNRKPKLVLCKGGWKTERTQIKCTHRELILIKSFSDLAHWLRSC